jgi:hypothetical protein
MCQFQYSRCRIPGIVGLVRRAMDMSVNSKLCVWSKQQSLSSDSRLSSPRQALCCRQPSKVFSLTNGLSRMSTGSGSKGRPEQRDPSGRNLRAYKEDFVWVHLV